ncbi:MAG: 50S ribosomal protein L32 [Actinomycetota bacterium]|nr:50S ribosomal protein L32 [Actinomycetota bacterium]
MAVPKRKTSKSKSRSHQSTSWVLNAPSKSSCPQCNFAKRPHHVCPNCGWYHGRQAIEVR